MAAPTITPLTTVPDRTKPGDEFSAEMAAFLWALAALPGQINGFIDWLGSNALQSYEFGSGTEAAPSFHPASDSGTGLWFDEEGMHVSVNGSKVMTFADGEITGPLVQSGADDGGDGKLLKIHGTTGAFGLGGVAVSTPDPNAVVDSGFYYYDASAANAPTSNGTILHIQRTASIHTQIAVSRANAGPGEMFVRANDGNGWTDWFEVFTQKSLLGSVSEVDGVPTGAVIERGSNANGEYVKFADGTMICNFTVEFANENHSTVTGAAYHSGTKVQNFPADFVAPPEVIPTFGRTNGAWDGWGTVTSVDVDRFNFILLSLTSDTQNRVLRYVAMGRWF